MAQFNVDSLAREHGVRVYDTALPQGWVDEVKDATGIYPPSVGFVWTYDPPLTFGGQAWPLTSEALDCLYAFHKMQLERAGNPNDLIGHVAFMSAERLAEMTEADKRYVCQTCVTINTMEARLK